MSSSLWCVVFDLGGVIGGNLPDFFNVLATTNPGHANLSTLFERNKDLWEKVKLEPAFTLSHYWAVIKRRENISDTEEDLSHKFREWTTPCQGVLDLMKRLRSKGVLTAICSNHATAFFDIFIEKYKLLECVDSPLIVVSQTVAVAKPDHKIFEIVDERIAAAVAGTGQAYAKERVILVDDQKKNTTSADRYGWKAVEFLNTRDTVESLTAQLETLIGASLH